MERGVRPPPALPVRVARRTAALRSRSRRARWTACESECGTSLILLGADVQRGGASLHLCSTSRPATLLAHWFHAGLKTHQARAAMRATTTSAATARAALAVRETRTVGQRGGARTVTVRRGSGTSDRACPDVAPSVHLEPQPVLTTAEEDVAHGRLAPYAGVLSPPVPCTLTESGVYCLRLPFRGQPSTLRIRASETGWAVPSCWAHRLTRYSSSIHRTRRSSAPGGRPAGSASSRCCQARCRPSTLSAS